MDTVSQLFTLKMVTRVRFLLFFLSSVFPNFSKSGRVNSTIWMHHMDADLAYREKARRKLHKNAMRYIEQIHQLYDHLPPISKTIQIKRKRHVGHCWRSKNKLTSNVLLWIIYLELILNSSVRTQDVVRRTCQKRWMIETNGERESGKSVLIARHDDDNDIFIKIFIDYWNNKFWIESKILPLPS